MSTETDCWVGPALQLGDGRPRPLYFVGNAPAAHTRKFTLVRKSFCRYHKLKAGKHLLLQGFSGEQNQPLRRYLCAMAWHFWFIDLPGEEG
jgi:hypothetical protein